MPALALPWSGSRAATGGGGGDFTRNFNIAPIGRAPFCGDNRTHIDCRRQEAARPDADFPKEARMPRYAYQCTTCDYEYDRRQSFGAAPEAECPRCDGLARRKFHAVPVIYKGSGFYTTDYARKK